MHALNPGNFPWSRERDIVLTLPGSDAIIRGFCLAMPEEVAGLVRATLLAAGKTESRYFRKSRYSARNGWAGVADEHALRGTGAPPAR